MNLKNCKAGRAGPDKIWLPGLIQDSNPKST